MMVYDDVFGQSIVADSFNVYFYWKYYDVIFLISEGFQGSLQLFYLSTHMGGFQLTIWFLESWETWRSRLVNISCNIWRFL